MTNKETLLQNDGCYSQFKKKKTPLIEKYWGPITSE